MAEREHLEPRGSLIDRFVIPLCLLGLLVLFAAALALTRFNPLVSFWEGLFESARLYEIWPILLLIFGVLFLLPGVLRHALTGRTSLARISTAMVIIMFLAGWLMLLEWSADWSQQWGGIMLALLAAWALLVAAAWLAYWEVWRSWQWSNQGVVNLVWRMLADGRFLSDLRRRLDRTWWRPWGSAHCLEVVQAYYDAAQERLVASSLRLAVPLTDAPDTANQHRQVLEAYLNAAESLVCYLCLRHPPPDDVVERAWRVAEIRREMITAVLWAQRFGCASQQSLPVQDWIEEFARLAGTVRPCYAQFMCAMFTLDAGAPQEDVRPVLRSTLAAFQQVVSEASQPGQFAHADVLSELCACAWLVFGSRAVPGQPCFDLWMGMRGIQGAGLTVTALPEQGAVTLTHAAAAVICGDLYRDWSHLTQPHWREGLEGRQSHSIDLLHRFLPPPLGRAGNDLPLLDQPSQHLLRRTRGISSWPYPEVCRCGRVWATGSAMFLPLALLMVVGLLAVCPNMSGNWGWNSIDRVADRRPGRDYRAAQAVALAQSGDWLAIGSADEGLTLMYAPSRIPRDRVFNQPILDVTAVEAGGFLALGQDWSIAQIGTPVQHGNPIQTATWLPKPEHPWLPIQSSRIGQQILVNELDDDGWLLAIRGMGVTRYLIHQQNGRVIRERSWQLTSWSDVPLEQAALTADGVWMALTGGGIGFADRATLLDVPGRSIRTPPIVSLDADPRDCSATAVDQRGGMWLHSRNDQGWCGPYFGHVAQTAARLRAVDDVTDVGLTPNAAWFGTDYGLFCYDRIGRRISSVIRDESVVAIAQPPNAERASAVLVATNKQLVRVAQPDAAGTCQQSRLVSGSIAEMGLSDNGLLCVYSTIEPSGARQLGVIPAPMQADPAAVTIIPDQPWSHEAESLQVVGIRSIGGRLLFATTTGAFIYDPQAHSYEDCSTAQFAQRTANAQSAFDPQIEQIQRPLASMDRLGPSDTSVLLMAENGRPFVLGKTPQQKSTFWVALDPFVNSHPDDLAEWGGHFYGLEKPGVLYEYHFPETWNSPRRFCTGQADVLQTATPGDQHAHGDLAATTEGDYRLAFLHGDRVITYDSQTAAIQQSSLPSQVLSDHITQIRLAENDQLYLLDDGRVIADESRTIFGQGVLDATLDDITALASNPDGVLIADNTGQIWAYDWPTGSWNTFGSRVMTNALTPDTITDMQSIGDSLLVRTRSGQVLFGQSRWSAIPEVRQWAAASDSRRVWFLGDNDVTRCTVASQLSQSDWPRTSFSRGAGMRSFIAGAAYAWPVGKTVIFLTAGGEMGRYDPATDNWEPLPGIATTAISQFVSDESHLYVLDQQRIRCIGRDLSVRGSVMLPFGVVGTCMQLEGATLKVAFVENGRPVVWELPADSLDESQKHERRRGGNDCPATFDMADVVWAQAKGADLFMLDGSGRCVSYNVDRGAWTQWSTADAGQSLYGWMPEQDGSGMRLLLATAERTTRIVRLIDGQVRVQQELAMLPQEIPAWLERLADQQEQFARRVPAMSQSLSQSIHMLHLAAQRYRDQIIKPHDGILAQTDQLQIERGAGRTEYRIKDGGNWSTASWRHGTFLHDRADDVAWAPSGNLWVLQDGRLRCLRTDKSRDGLTLTDQTLALSRSVQQIDTLPGGRIGAELSDRERMELDESHERLLEWSPVTEPVILATSDIADQKLNWCWLSDGHLATAWRSGTTNLKLWSQDNDCLAMQSVSDIAMDEQGNLLLITEMGLIVRDAGNYALKALYPEIPAQTRFVRLIGPQRTLLCVDEQFAYEWDGNRLRPLSGRDRVNAASTLDSGPWRWQLPIGPTSRGPVTINHRDNARPRRLASVNTGGWKFQDDCVNWIARDSQAAQIWLNTDDGMWRFHPTTGRTASTDASDQTSPGDPPLAVHTPAISMDYAHGRIIMHAYDGGPVYEQGRFFHDQASSLSSRPDGLYLLNQRCMIRRDGEKPGRITACWPLPPLLDTARPAKLGSDGTAIRCMGSDLLGRLHLWELQGDTWQDLGEPPQQIIASIGPVNWFADAVADRCEPRLGSTSAVVIDHWWSKDRFAWDRVLSASPLSATQLIVQTPMGLVAMRCGINDSAFQISAIWPQTGLIYCEAARDNGRQVGVVAGNMAGDVAYLVTEDIAGQPHCTRTDDPAPLRCRAQVSLVQSNPQGDLESRRIDWRLSWQQTASSVAALTSALDKLDMRDMLRDGQFLFDRADCACELDVAGGRLWLMAASGHGATDAGLVCLNRIADDAGETQHAPLLLADILDRRGFLAMRSAGPDAVWGLQDQAEHAPQIWIGSLTTGPLTWSRGDSSQARAAFEVGQSVQLDVAAMRWSAQPRSRWEHSTDVFQWQPAGYPLFQSAAMGTTLSFDMLHSLTLDRAQHRLLIATSGGIVDCPYDPADGSICLSDASTRLRWESNGQSLVPATRIRLDQSGDVWLMPGPQNQSICLGRSTGSPPWTTLDYNGLPIDLHRQGFSWRDRQYDDSNDAWLPQRRTLTDVVEATVDVNHDAMWLVTESGGLVKVRPEHLPP